MPSKRKKAERTAGVPEVRIPPELLGELVKGPMTAAEVESVCRSEKWDDVITPPQWFLIAQCSRPLSDRTRARPEFPVA